MGFSMSSPTSPGSTRGSGGVAVLYKKELHDRVHVVHKDVDARYMWIRIKRGDLRELYIAICYFPPAYSRFAPLGESPYLPLYDDIIRFATMGDIMLLGDFNARTKDEQTTMFDTNEAVYGEVMAEEVGLKRQAQDMSAITEYGKHFLALGSAHGFVIYNGLSQWPGSDALTCWNPKGGASTVDYLMGSPSLIPEIKEFTISGRPIGLAADHAYLRFEVKDGCTKDVYAKESGLAKYLFTRETIDVYSCGVYNGMLDLDPFAPLEELTQGLSKSLHKAATNAFTHTMDNPPKLGRVIQNS